MTTRHISLPLRKGNKGYFATVPRDIAIEENLRSIIFVEPGERIMRNDIGVPLRTSLWEPNDDILLSALITFIRGQISRFETRVRLISVEGNVDEDSDGQSTIVRIFVEYQILPEGRVKSITGGLILERKPK